MKTLIALLFAIVTLAGCASSQEYSQYVAAQSDANRLAAEGQKPLVRITAQPGQSITGLAGLEVYMPTSAPVIQQARANEWIGVVGQGISVLGAVAGLKVSGDAAIGLADSVGSAANRGYSSIQAPAANVSTVTTTTTTDASNRSVATTTTDASNRSTTTGATSLITGSYNPTSDSSTHTASTTTGSYNPVSDSSTHSTPTTSTTTTSTTAAPAP